MSVGVGCRDAAQTNRTATLFDTPLSADLWAELRNEGLLHPNARLGTGHDVAVTNEVEE